MSAAIAAIVTTSTARVVPWCRIGLPLLPRGWRACGPSLPRSDVILTLAVGIALSTFPADLLRRVSCTSTAQFVHEFLVFIIRTSDRATWWSIITPILATSTIWAVASHVAGIATNATDYVGGVVLCLRAVVLAMADLATVLAGLILVVAQSTVKRCELS